ncbi:MAG: hypothetical protein JW893_00635 [Candidatus Omnitrophica bacterium]|nr:hypothetical protein [Candidatus Omnitrophota bacterium]
MVDQEGAGRSQKASWILGILLILTGFWAGTHPNIIFAFIGFLCFFVVGVTIILEGRKKKS